MDEFPYYMGIIKGRGYALPEDMKDWELYDIYESLEDDEKKDYITFIYDGDALTEDFIKQIFDLGLDNEAAAYAIKLFRKELENLQAKNPARSYEFWEIHTRKQLLDCIITALVLCCKRC